MNNGLFRSAIKQAATAASTSETRPVLTGILCECDNDALTLAATDGVRLASRTLHIENNSHAEFQAVIPAKNLYEVSKLLSNDDDTTEIEVSDNRVRFTTDGLIVESALLEGTYPSVKNLIPPSYLCEIQVDKDRLLTAVECVTVLASERIIRLEAGATKLKLLSRTAEVGDMENEVPLMGMSGEEFILSLNGKYLIDILRNSDCPNVRIRYAGRTNPIVVLPNDSLMSALFLITPVRTRD
ncbi:DNA polymerase-3 subunit beta [Cohnella lubricantis]|nr:DNA polymerase-3 subunit beta [Cohnella lubricantis]